MTSAAKTLEVQGWELVVGEDDRPMVRDIDLGARLGFARAIEAPAPRARPSLRLLQGGAQLAMPWGGR
jgi:hypothetical protein